jgi:hypothetical protein
MNNNTAKRLCQQQLPAKLILFSKKLYHKGNAWLRAAEAERYYLSSENARLT